jgi:hypothetical protein
VDTRGRWTRERLHERVEMLAADLDGEEFVKAVARFSEEELEPGEQALLGEILLERAEEEHDIQQVIRRRVRERGWFRRTMERLERLGARNDVAEVAAGVATVVAEEHPDPEQVDAIVEELRADRGFAARVLDELSRHSNADVRGWVSWAIPEVLEDGGAYILLGLTRDRDPAVRDGAIEELVALDPDLAQKLVPSLRRRLRSRDAQEAVTAMWTLAELGDRDSLPLIRRIAEADKLDHPHQRLSAEVACTLLGDRPEDALDGLRAHDHERMPWLATAARILGTPEARLALENCARDAPDEDCRRACVIELEKLEERAA